VDDKELAQKRTDLANLLNQIDEMNADARLLATEIAEETERRKDLPGGTMLEFRPRPSNGPQPTDQGSQ
jgi:hypothetical protein